MYIDKTDIIQKYIDKNYIILLIDLLNEKGLETDAEVIY